ncbi:MAG: prepilin-type N-terminal cleavage/methylation domain-containing protein [Candidatus Uhrbacteria bacterium]
MQKRRGFTLIELLVVIAIIGLLATLAVIAVSSARVKARDARRISDIKQVQSALELYAVSNSGYPGALLLELGINTEGNEAECLNDSGFVKEADCDSGGSVYMRVVPKYPSPPEGWYEYYGKDDSTGGIGSCAQAAAPCVDYGIQFILESGVGDLPGSTVCTATSSGITCG